jgi:hypothetical protein
MGAYACPTGPTDTLLHYPRSSVPSITSRPMKPPWNGNPDQRAAALSPGSGYRNLHPENRDRAQAGDDPEADERIPRLSIHASSRARFMEKPT